MQNLLRIDSSARTEGSHSRALGDYFEQKWREANPKGQIAYRDLVRQPVDQLAAETIAGFYTPEDQMTVNLKAATETSDRLIAEVQASDTLLITAPIYNFSVPASLKAWIDQVVRIGRTFAFDGAAFSGLAKPDTAVVCAVYGAAGYEQGGPFRAANFLETYLDFLLKFLGISHVHFITLQSTNADEAALKFAVDKAHFEIDEVLNTDTHGSAAQ